MNATKIRVDRADERSQMVAQQLESRGIRSQRVLDAMRTVPREEFVSPNLREFAYRDTPLPIAGDQTISQPFVVAFMVELLGLRGGEKVLEIGAGSGYAAAVISRMAAKVFTIERISELASGAASALRRLDLGNVRVRLGDGTLGWPEESPFDAIIVSAGAPAVPESLKHQLKVGGTLVIPVGRDCERQKLVRVTRLSANKFRSEDIATVRFVPLIGDEGWQVDNGSATNGPR